MEEKESYKEETVKTFNEAKENLKNVDIKEEAKIGKGFIKDLIERPAEKIESITKDEHNKYFKTIILVTVLWCIAILCRKIITYIKLESLFKFDAILLLIKATIAPIITILVLSAIVFILNKERKKSLVTTITTIGTAKLPLAVASVISLLSLIDTKANTLISPINGLLSAVSMILVYFAIKDLFEIEDNTQAIKKFTYCMIIYEIVAIICYLFGIYI